MPALDDRFFQAIGLVAILLYLIPGIFRLDAGKRRVAMAAATGLVVIGIVAALATALF